MNHQYIARAGALVVVGALALAACGGSGSSASPGEASSAASTVESMAPSSAESMAESAAPSMAPIDVTGAADSISNLTSYVLDIVATGADSGTQSMSITAVHDPVDATHYVMDDLEMIIIQGQGAWMNQAGTWIEVPGATDTYLSVFKAMTPDTLIGSFALGLYGSGFRDAGSEQHNGVDTTHYHLDASDVADMGGTGFPDDGTMDIWIANDGGYLVGMQYGGTDPDSGEMVQLSMEVSRVNDPSLTIEPPI